MSWLVLSLISLACYVIYDVSGRYLATRSQNPRAFAAIFNALVTLLAPLVFLVDKTPPTNLTPVAIALTMIGLTLWGLMGRFEYYAKKHTEASVLAITAKIATVMTFVLGVIFLHESFTTSKLVAIVLIISANLLLFAGQKRHTVISREGFLYTSILIAILSVAWIFDTVNVRNWGVGTFTILSFLSPTLVSGLLPPLKLTEIKAELKLTPWWQFGVLSILILVGYAFMLKALTVGEASNVIPIISSTTPFVVILGVIFLGERKNLFRKLFASALAVIAIYLMR